MKTYEYQIETLTGTIEKENMRSAVASAFLAYLDHTPGISERQVSLRLKVREIHHHEPARPEPVRTYVIYNHQTKGNAYIRALWENGRYVRGDAKNSNRRFDFCLVDHAITSRIPLLEDLALNGTENFFCYPHTARPNLVNDITGEFEGVTAHFVSAPGHVEVMRAYGYEKPLHVVGWSLCPILPFRPTKGFKVLFAPIHERCAEIDKQANQAAFRRLRLLAEAGEIELTVRYYRAPAGKGLAGSGLEEIQHPNIHYTCIESLEPDWEQIDQADIVVSHQTYAWMAVARGVPAVMMAEDMPAHLIPRGETDQYAKHWNSYQDLLAYPIDLLASSESNALSILQKAASSDKEIAGWRERMIGSPFSAEAFINSLEGYL